jgi:alkanesulfonate monooxygenase SsuD/methylene tetrahydromethanopterin reductase-like flavin-dependent oxidoreductase (luciferase family)
MGVKKKPAVQPKTAKRRRPGPARPSFAGAPVLLGTVESVNELNRWIAAELAAGQLTSTAARELTATARTALAAVRTEAGLDQMARLEMMLARAEEVHRARAELLVSAKTSQDEPAEFLLDET